MEYWEFLLQREGDRAWLPLESSSVEILEGPYRLAARSSRPLATVEIQLTYRGAGGVPLEKRVQKRMGQTNQEGLMAVLPFTVFRPGIWELSCSSEILSDLWGDVWRHAVQLHVLPQDGEEGNDGWEDDWQGGAPREDSLDLNPNPSDPYPQKSLGSPSGAIAPPMDLGPNPPPDQGPQPWDHGSDEPQGTAPDPGGSMEAPTVGALDALQMGLTSDRYHVGLGQSLTMGGQITWGMDSPLAPPPSLQGTLRVDLRSPSTGQVLVSVQQSLPASAPPLAFRCAVAMPPTYQEGTLLGEVVLYLAARGAEPALTQAFTIDVLGADGGKLQDLEPVPHPPDRAMLGEVPGDQPDPDGKVVFPDPLASPPWNSPWTTPAPWPVQQPDLNLGFLELLHRAQAREAPRLQPRPPQPLPPRLGGGAVARTQGPQLPPLPRQRPVGGKILNPALDTLGDLAGTQATESLIHHRRFQDRLQAFAKEDGFAPGGTRSDLPGNPPPPNDHCPDPWETPIPPGEGGTPLDRG